MFLKIKIPQKLWERLPKLCHTIPSLPFQASSTIFQRLLSGHSCRYWDKFIVVSDVVFKFLVSHL